MIAFINKVDAYSLIWIYIHLKLQYLVKIMNKIWNNTYAVVIKNKVHFVECTAIGVVKENYTTIYSRKLNYKPVR